MGGGQARRIAGPILGQIELAINEGMPFAGNIGSKDADLTVCDLAG
jgi:hypothetical protein